MSCVSFTSLFIDLLLLNVFYIILAIKIDEWIDKFIRLFCPVPKVGVGPVNTDGIIKACVRAIRSKIGKFIEPIFALIPVVFLLLLSMLQAGGFISIDFILASTTIYAVAAVFGMGAMKIMQKTIAKKKYSGVIKRIMDFLFDSGLRTIIMGQMIAINLAMSGYWIYETTKDCVTS